MHSVTGVVKHLSGTQAIRLQWAEGRVHTLRLTLSRTMLLATAVSIYSRCTSSSSQVGMLERSITDLVSMPDMTQD